MTPRDDDVPILEPGGPRRSMPAAVLWAGILWIVYGVLQLISILLAVIPAVQAGQSPVTPQTGCSLLFGIAFLFVGYQTVTGTAKDTLGNAIGSLILGLLAALLAVMILAGGQQLQIDPRVRLAAAISAGLSATLLIVAGVLALAGRADYRAWRSARGPYR